MARMDMAVKKNILRVSCIILVLLAMTLSIVLDAAADMAGGSGDSVDGSGAGSGCDWDISTCYGATWRWYPWTGDEVRIPGGGKDFLQSMEITGDNAKICKQMGGYYRYAMVRKSTGEQVGAMPFGGNTLQWTSNAADPNGRLKYRGPSDANGGIDFNVVKSGYEAWKNANPGSNLPATLNSRSNVMWFCASGDVPGGDPVINAAACDGIDFKGDTTQIATRVRNKSNIGSGWSNEAWVGVGQTAEWGHCYYPGVQTYAKKEIYVGEPDCGTLMSGIGIGGWSEGIVYDEGRQPKPQSQYNPFNLNIGRVMDYKKLENMFKINRSFNDSNVNEANLFYYYGVGTVDMREEYYNYSVGRGNVAQTLTQSATTGTPTKVTLNNEGKVDKRCGWGVRYFTGRYTPNTCNDSEREVGCNPGYYDYQKTVCTQCSKDLPLDACLNTEYCTRKETKCYARKGTAAWGRGCSKEYKTRSESVGFVSNQNKITYWSNGANATSDNASVKVPINYTIKGTIGWNTEVVDAGTSTGGFTGTVESGAKWNNRTGNSYATNAEQVKYSIVSFIADSDKAESLNVEFSSIEDGAMKAAICRKTPDAEHGFVNNAENCENYVRNTKAEFVNGNGHVEAGATYNVNLKNTSLSVPDVTAGNYFCAAIAVYPTNSGRDTQMDWNGNSGKWGIYNAKCSKIAKRPTLQVWGSSIFTASLMQTNRTRKNNLYTELRGDKGYTSQMSTSKEVWAGAWSEQAVIGAGRVIGMASGGAGRGGGNISNKNDLAGYSPYCYWFTPLSFSNWSTNSAVQLCPNYDISGGMYGGVADSVKDRSTMLSGLEPGKGTTIKKVSGEVNLMDEKNYIKFNAGGRENIRYTYSDGTITIKGPASANGMTKINNWTTHIVHAKGNVIIAGDITYQNGEVNNLKAIPKLIIYAENNIFISCSGMKTVERIDAILIAGNNVDTCFELNNDYDNPALSRPLRINGSVIANRLLAKRTYGAGKGEDTFTPAEVINYDTSVYLWSASMSNEFSSNQSSMTVTYQRELAPRY